MKEFLHARKSLLRGAAILIALAAPAAHAQTARPTHQDFVVAGVGTGNTIALPENRSRSYLGLINDSANLVYCRVDGSATSNTAADANTGLRLAAAGTTGDRHFFFPPGVPQGPVRCYSATNGSRVLLIEGR